MGEAPAAQSLATGDAISARSLQGGCGVQNAGGEKWSGTNGRSLAGSERTQSMLSPVADRQICEFAELIYAATNTPGGWQRLFARFAELFPGTGSGLVVRSSGTPGGIIMAHSNFLPGAVDEFLTNHALNSPWIPILHSVPTGVPFATEDHVPIASIQHTPLYRRFLKPFEIGNLFAVRFKDEHGGRAMFVVSCSSEAYATLKPVVMPVLEKLVPHFQRALEISWTFRRQRIRGLEDGLARQADPVFVLNKLREIVFMNASAQAAMERGALPLSPSTGQFRLPVRSDMARFESLFEATHSGAPGAERTLRHLMTFTVPGQRAPSVLELLCLLPSPDTSGEDMFHDTRAEPSCLVTLRFRDALRTPTIADIRNVLGLSPMEADAALALAEGRSVEQHARVRGVSVETVRWHLKNAYQRTECAGQAELLRLVLSLVGPPRLG